ncbi:MAG: DUF1800 domain-containing protein [Fimbriimonadaceae bacterium]|nr:DUF1800 domain-containing protein [Fimbriimonadaceae bacterium]
MISRRDLFRLGAIGGAGTLLTGCAEVSRRLSPEVGAAKVPTGSVEPELRLANRLAFGPSGNDLVELRELGREAWIRRELAANRPYDVRLQLQLRRTAAIHYEAGELRDLPETEVLRHLQQATVLRAVYSPNQLHERMVDFWSNHFNLNGKKWPVAYSLPLDARRVVRENALGRFEDLLMASAKSPAMLQYLDNQVNKKGIPNENYAREIMELHTLGVDGGYTQRDVMEVARCFTGWGIENGFLKRRGAFKFDADYHDGGSKVVLGQRIAAGGGLSDGERVVALLARHPSTARFLARKACDYFLGHAPEALVAKMAKRYLADDTSVRALLEPLLFSDALDEAPPVFKRPLDYVVSAIRVTGAQTDGGPAVLEQLRRMGQPLYEWPMPDGYPVETPAWTGGMLARWNFAIGLTSAKPPGTTIVNADAAQRAIAAVVPDLAASVAANPAQVTRLGLMSPAFQWK